MKAGLRIVNGFLHDFAAGAWAACVLFVFWIDSQDFTADVVAVLSPLERRFFWIAVALVVIVMITGAGRTFTYVGDVYGEQSEKSRRQLLIIKHILLVIVFGTGTLWLYTMAYG